MGLVVLMIGAAFTFFGYQLFRVLIPFWGFFVGFTWGAQAIATGMNTGFLATVFGWVIGIIAGLVLAALAYFFYVFAVAVLTASIGYWLTAGLFMAMGLQMGFFLTFLAFIVGIALAVAAVYYNAPKGLLIVLAAFGGATAMIAGVLVFFGAVPVAALGTSLVDIIIRQSLWWTLVWIALTAIGIFAQMQISQAEYIDESNFSSYYPSSYAGAKGGSAKGDKHHHDKHKN